jgi:hypothetical protein
VLSSALVWLLSERASSNTVVMNDDDNEGRREIMSFWFVVCRSCLLVCMRTLVNQQERGEKMENDEREEREWDMTWETENVTRLLRTHLVLHR